MGFGNSKRNSKILKLPVLYFRTILAILFFQFGFSQSAEEQIYVVTENFRANPTLKSLQKLIDFEQKIQPENKPELLAIVILNCNKAYYQNQFGQTQNAISSFEKAWSLFDKYKLKNYDIIEFCLKPLGNLYTQIGDFENAENTIKNYFYIANTTKNESQKISAIQNLSVVYYSSGRTIEAIALLQNELKSTLLNKTQQGILLSNLGANYLSLDNIIPAKSAFLKSIVLLKSDQNQTETLANSYRNLSRIYASKNNFEQANLYFKKAKALLILSKNSSVRQKAKLFLEEASLLFEQNKFIESQQILKELFTVLLPDYSKNQKIPNSTSLYAETVLLDAFDLQAALFSSKKEFKKALQWFTLSFEVEELLQSTLVYENSKIIALIGNRNRVEKCITLYEQLYKKELNSNYLKKAFLLSEQSKAAVLKTTILQNKKLSIREKELAKAIQNQTIIIINEQQKGTNANIKSINQAIQKQNELMLILKSQNKNTIVEQNPITISSVFEKLKKEHAILITYFYGNEKTYCFTIENEHLKMNSFENLKSTITSFLAYFSDSAKITNDVLGFTKSSKSLYDYLKIPIQNKVKNLIIIPDGILNFVPFEALITKKNVNTNFEKMSFLIDDFQISYQNSVGFYLDHSSKNSAQKEEKVLGVFPVFEKTDYELMYSTNEMNAIKSNFNGEYLEKNKATFENFKQKAQNFSILHLCTHATSGDTDEPASIKFFDRNVLYSELYNLDLKPKLVVLSACETGLGKLYKAEGAMSVSRGFQMAGAQNVLFSLWKVNDYTTSVFMEKFYSALKKGSSFAQANHKAKLAFLADGSISNAKKSPYYWCSMAYYGQLEINHGNDLLFYFIALGIILSGIVFLYIKKGSHF